MAQCTSLISSEEYLCGIYHNNDGNLDFAIYRWKVSGLQGDDKPEYSYFRLPDAYECLSVGAFASIGTKIYMVGGVYKHTDCSTDIFVVETKKLHTNDVGEIVRKIPSALNARVRNRNAVAIGGEIYTFPINFGHPAQHPKPWSRFEVFNPVTETTRWLPEPNLPRKGGRECYIVLKSQIILCTGSQWLSAFDTASPRRGWRDVTRDFIEASVGICVNPLPFLPTLVKTECATELGGHDDDDGGRFFGTCIADHYNPCFAVFKLGSDPFRIEKWYKVIGIPQDLLLRPRFAHGSNVFFTYRAAKSPDDEKLVWEFKKFSLAYRSDEDLYAAGEVFSFQGSHGTLPGPFYEGFVPTLCTSCTSACPILLGPTLGSQAPPSIYFRNEIDYSVFVFSYPHLE